MKTIPVLMMAAGFCGILASQGALLVYEGFDYSQNTNINTCGGGLGFLAESLWAGGGTNDASAGPIIQNSAIQAEPIDWDGVLVGNLAGLAVTGRFVGMGSTGADHLNGSRALDPSVTATFVGGSVTWMSAIFSRTGISTLLHHKPSLALGSAALSVRAQLVGSTGDTALGFGTNYNVTNGPILAAAWNATSKISGTGVTQKLGGVLGNNSQQLVVAKIEWDKPVAAVDEVQSLEILVAGDITLSDGVDTTILFDPAGDPAMVKARLETDITAIDSVTVTGDGSSVSPFVIIFQGVQAGSNVVSLIAANGTGAATVTTVTNGSPATAWDTLSVYNFGENDTDPISEATFNAAVKGVYAADLDQSTFDTISFGGSRFHIDEIRVGSTFLHVIGGVPAITPYEVWAKNHITDIDEAADSSAAGDPDGDGQNNLMEFALDGTPLDGALNGRIHLSSQASDYSDDKALILTLAVRAGTVFPSGENIQPSASMDGVTYTIEGGKDLNGFLATIWTNDPADPKNAALNDGLPVLDSTYEYRSFTLKGSESPSLNPKGFLRVKIEPSL